MSKRIRCDREIVLDIIELYLELLDNEIETKPFADDEARELFKEHIADDIKESIKSSEEYLNLKVVLMRQDDKEKIEKTIKTFLEMLRKKGIAIDEDETGDNFASLRRWVTRRTKT